MEGSLVPEEAGGWDKGDSLEMAPSVEVQVYPFDMHSVPFVGENSQIDSEPLVRQVALEAGFDHFSVDSNLANQIEHGEPQIEALPDGWAEIVEREGACSQN